MRLVTWNANCRFRDKIRLFSPDQHDVLVIQECENTEKSKKAYGDAGWHHVWIGSNPNKGLGVFVANANSIEPLDWPVQQCRYFLPVRVFDDITIVGVWAMGGKTRNTSYAGQITQFLNKNKERIRSAAPVIAGDFNSNAIWDNRHAVANHTVNNEVLETLGLTSLYHAKEGSAPGEERKFTFYMYRDPTKPYHLDYLYLPSQLASSSTIRLGSPQDWLEHSDHMPLYIDLPDDKSLQWILHRGTTEL